MVHTPGDGWQRDSETQADQEAYWAEIEAMWQKVGASGDPADLEKPLGPLVVHTPWLLHLYVFHCNLKPNRTRMFAPRSCWGILTSYRPLLPRSDLRPTKRSETHSFAQRAICDVPSETPCNASRAIAADYPG
jgi:hypothetical protein